MGLSDCGGTDGNETMIFNFLCCTNQGKKTLTSLLAKRETSSNYENKRREPSRRFASILTPCLLPRL